MLIHGLDPLYRRVLAAPHDEYILVEVLDSDGNVLAVPPASRGIDGGLEVIPGSVVTASLASQVTRKAMIEVDGSLYPEDIDDLLAPYGNRLRITRGIKFADGSHKYAWIIFTGKIHDVELTPDGTCSVVAYDRANEVREAAFVFPTNSQTTNTVYQEFVRLITEGVPDALFGASDPIDLPVAPLTWASDRGGALEEMATSAGAFWYALADGSFVLRRYAWTVPGDPVVTLSDGPGGLLAGAPSRTRETVYNSVTITGERADGTTPVAALAQDTDPSSPTSVNGPFGRRHLTVALRTPQTQGSAQAAANDWLRRSIGLFETWRWDQTVDAALELGDVVELNAYGRSGIIQVVSGYSIPLEPGGFMSVQAHAQVLGGIQ